MGEGGAGSNQTTAQKAGTYERLSTVRMPLYPCSYELYNKKALPVWAGWTGPHFR
jgi:hypothetical protein